MIIIFHNSGWKTLFIILLLSFANTAMGLTQVKTFNQSVSEFWDNDLNWTPVGTPSILDSVVIDYRVIIPYDQAGNAQTINILSNGELVINHKNDTSARLIIIGNLHSNGIYNAGTLVNHGEIIMLNHQIGVLNGGVLKNKNTGIIDLYAIEYSFIHNMDSLLNKGQIFFSQPNSSSSSINYYPLMNEGVCINTGYWLIDSMDYGGILNSGGNAIFQNEDTLIINEFALLGGVLWYGIQNINGTVNNTSTGYIKILNTDLSYAAIRIEQSILENFGEISIQDSYSSFGIQVLSDGVLRNEGFIGVSDVINGMSIQVTGSFYQRSTGETVIQNCSSEPFIIEDSAILEIEGILDVL